jgi:hypothetical protein
MRFPQTTTRTKTLSSRQGRMQIYSCDFCEFIQSNIKLVDDKEPEMSELMDGAFEAKYLFHMRTVHGLEK